MRTYRYIKAILDKMTNEQLDQQAQIMLPQFDHDKAMPLHPVISFETVKALVSAEEGGKELQETRSSFDNEHHSDHFVFLVDWNMFAEDGAIAFDLETGEKFYGKNTKKNIEVEDEFNNTFPTNRPE